MCRLAPGHDCNILFWHPNAHIFASTVATSIIQSATFPLARCKCAELVANQLDQRGWCVGVACSLIGMSRVARSYRRSCMDKLP